MDTTVSDFNTLLLDLVDQIIILFPKSILAGNKDVIEMIMEKNNKKIIDYFVMYILKYKKQIDSGDESFFLENTFSEDITSACKEADKRDTNDIFKKAFEFKTMWKTINKENKKVIIQYMQMLSSLALNYASDLYKKK